MIRFMKYRWVYFILSASVLIPGIYSLIRFGLKPSIDFTGGAILELKIAKPQTNVTLDEVKPIISNNQIELASIQLIETNTILMRTKPISRDQSAKLEADLGKIGPVTETRFETVGPILGQELLKKTVIAAIIAATAILIYVAWAFKNFRFGVSAIIALIHDLLVVVSIFSILGKVKGVEVDTLFVTAILTTMSFSVHDTIVVFDRIRESLKHGSGGDFETLVNKSLTETIGRSLNNSFTIIFMLLALFLLGGETIHWFILALLVGTISGAYSSPFVATPVLYVWYKIGNKKALR